MAVGYIKRLAGPYTGAGTKTLPFGFKIFAPTDIYVALAEKENEPSTNLVYGSGFTVSVNENQDVTPGGTVELVTPLTGDQRVSVGTNIPYTQETQLTNYNRFPPELVNTGLDRIVIQIQQIVEILGRAVVTDPTDTLTPGELKQKLLDAADSAYEVAKGFADLAQQYAEAAKESEVKTAEYAEAATVIKPYTDQITKTADAIESVKSVGDAIDSVKTVSQEIETVKEVGEGMENIRKAAELQPHIDDIKTAGEHVDEIHKVGQDLQGVEASDFDCGEIGDPIDPIVTVEGGYIKKVAEHIDDCIHPVGDSLEDIKKVADNLDAVNETAELARIDYEKVFKEGV